MIFFMVILDLILVSQRKKKKKPLKYLFNLGSYTDTFKCHQRRLQEEKLGRKSVVSDYRNFVQNGGFGPTFGSQDFPQTYTYGEKV